MLSQFWRASAGLRVRRLLKILPILVLLLIFSRPSSPPALAGSLSMPGYPAQVTATGQPGGIDQVWLDTVPRPLVDARVVSGMAWGDIDGDGDLDLAAASRVWPTTLYLNLGGELEDLEWGYQERQVTTAVAWGDVDGDGDLDLAMGNYSAPNLLFINAGGRLEDVPHWSDEVSDRTQAITWGDFNGDGFLDLVVGNSRQQNRLYLNTGDGTLATEPAWVGELEDNTVSLASADFNRDGSLDLAVANHSFLDEASVVYRNEPGDGLSFSRVWESSESRLADIAWGDVNADGYPELGIVAATLDAVREDGLFSNVAGVLATDPSWQAAEASRGTSIVWGDVDGDGDLDLAVGSSSDAKEGVYLNRAGTLDNVPAWTSTDTARVTELAWVDVDRDTDLDLAAIYGGQIFVYLNRQWPMDGRPDWEDDAPDTRTMSVAWGDADNDGRLDPAMGNGDPFLGIGHANVIYHNSDGVLDSADVLYRAPADDITTSVAWGDLNGDGWLDLAVGNYGQDNYVLLNQAGSFDYDARVALTGIDESGRILRAGDNTWSVAWGDVDRDGDLDLAVGNDGEPNRLYFNVNGELAQDAVLTFGAQAATRSLAWGDIDADGDLDLAEGIAGEANRIYFAGAGGLSDENTVTFGDADETTSLAWGDMNGDGLPDLIVGNSGEVNKLYLNVGGVLSAQPTWVSLDRDDTCAVSLGDVDGDGDLDLAVANGGGLDGAASHPDKIYLNERGTLQTVADSPWRARVVPSYSAAWADVDGDGDLDLMFGSGPTTGRTTNLQGHNRLYLNDRQTTTGPPTRAAVILDPDSSPVTTPTGGSYTSLAPAALNAQAGVRQDGLVPVSYELYRPDLEPVRAVRAFYSLDGGGSWFVARPTPETQITDLSTTPGENKHVFTWDVFGSNLYGQSDNVVFRIEAYETLPADMGESGGIGAFLYTDQAAGTSQQPFAAANTRPFRVRGNQVQVFREVAGGDPVPAAGAFVYRLAADQESGGVPLPGGSAALQGTAFTTDVLGNLQGRTVLQPDEQLVALWPAPADEARLPFTDKVTLFYLSAVPEESRGLALAGAAPQRGALPLIVSERNPLILFHLDISLEWDARQDDIFLLELANSIARSSEVLFDVTNGQAAIGDVRVFHSRHYWNSADIVVLANNGLRPSAAIGGIVQKPVSETLRDGTTVIEKAYWPGQIRMGPGWDPFGESTADLGRDWHQALAHELAHYLLFLPDNYLGFEENGTLRRINCRGSFMTSTYDPSYSEFLTRSQWDAAGESDCGRSLAENTTGRADWETIEQYYPMLAAPTAATLDGPHILPLEVTHIFTLESTAPRQPLPARNFDIRDADANRIRLPHAQAYVIDTQGTEDLTDDVLLALGAPTGGGDRLKVRGAHPGDRLCVFGSDAGVSYAGCVDPLRVSDVSVELSPVSDVPGIRWEPQISVEPVDRTTLNISVIQELEDAAQLQVQVYPAHYGSMPCNYGLSPTTTLDRDGSLHAGQVQLKWEDYEVVVRVWVEGENRREAVAGFILTLPPAEPATAGAEDEEAAATGAADATTAATSAAAVLDQACLEAGLLPGRNVNEAAARYSAVYLPVAGPNTNPLGGPNTNPLGGPNTNPLGGPNTNPLGGPNTNPLGGPNTNPLGGPNTNPLGGPNTNPLGGPNTNPLGGPNTNPLGGAGNVATGNAEARPGSAPLFSADAQLVIYSKAGYFESSGVRELQLLSEIPLLDRHPWLTPVGQSYRIVFDPTAEQARFLAFTYLQRDVPEGYEDALSLYFLPEGGSVWERIETELYVENLAVAEIADGRDGAYVLMASVGLPQLLPGWNLMSFPLPVSRPVGEVLEGLECIALAVQPATWRADGTMPALPQLSAKGDDSCPALESSVAAFEFGRLYWIYVTEPATLFLAPPERDATGVLR